MRSSTSPRSGASKELNNQILDESREVVNLIGAACAAFNSEIERRSSSGLFWPPIRCTAGETQIERYARVTRLTQEWTELENGYWKAEGAVDGIDGSFPLFLTVRRISDGAKLADHPPKCDVPHLEVIVSLARPAPPFHRLDLKWRNIDDWLAALQKEAATAELARKADEAVARRKYINERVKSICCDAVWSRLPWPVLSGRYGGVTRTHTARATMISDHWRETQKGLVAEAVAEDIDGRAVPVTVLIRPWDASRPHQSPKAQNSTRKFLLIEFDVPIGVYGTTSYHLKWAGIEEWQINLVRKAREGYFQHLSSQALSVLDDIGTLALLPEAEKTQAALRLLGLHTHPPRQETVDKEWKSGRTCWRALALKYGILNLDIGGIVTAEDIATNPILLNLLSLEVDAGPLRRRMKSAYAWLSQLERAGWLRRSNDSVGEPSFVFSIARLITTPSALLEPR